MVLNTYLDLQLETRLNEDETMMVGTLIMGDWSCLLCLAMYFTKQVVMTTETHSAQDVLKRQSEEMDPMSRASNISWGVYVAGLSTTYMICEDKIRRVTDQNT